MTLYPNSNSKYELSSLLSVAPAQCTESQVHFTFSLPLTCLETGNGVNLRSSRKPSYQSCELNIGPLPANFKTFFIDDFSSTPTALRSHTTTSLGCIFITFHSTEKSLFCNTCLLNSFARSFHQKRDCCCAGSFVINTVLP